MSKRRRGERHTYFQVPKLKDLAQHAVHVASGRPVARTFEHHRSIMGDTTMSEPSAKRARTGANEVGQGLGITVPRNIPQGYNNNYTVTLTYADSKLFTISMAGGSAQQVWAANSIYDPDVTGTGHQPLLRDLWASQYDYYAVLAARYKFTFYNGARDLVSYTAAGTSSQTIGGVAITILPTTNAADITSATTGYMMPALEMKNTYTKFLWPEMSVTVEGELTPGDFLVDAVDSDTDRTWTAVGANPALLRYIGISMNSVNSATIVGQNEQPYAAIQGVFEIEYDVQFTQLNQTLRGITS